MPYSPWEDQHVQGLENTACLCFLWSHHDVEGKYHKEKKHYVI